MTSKLSSLALLAAVTATAQTTATKPPVHHTATATASAAKTASNIPKVVGIPKTLYALRYVDITPGTGPLAQPSILGSSQADSKIMWYTVRYTGWLKDGTKFDSSYDHPGGEPITFPAGIRRVIAGWDSGFEGMHVGGKRRLFIPWELAYGEAGRPPKIPAKADLIFDIELVKQSDTPPEELRRPAAPPANSQPKPATEQPKEEPQTDKPATTAQPQTNPHPQSL